MRNQEFLNKYHNIFQSTDPDAYFERQMQSLSTQGLKRDTRKMLPPVDTMFDRAFRQPNENIKKPAFGSNYPLADTSSLYSYNPKPLTRPGNIVDSLESLMNDGRHTRSTAIISIDKQRPQPIDAFVSVQRQTAWGGAEGYHNDSRYSIMDTKSSIMSTKNLVIKSRITNNILGTADNILNSSVNRMEEDQGSKRSIAHSLNRQTNDKFNYDQFLSSMMLKDSLKPGPEPQQPFAGKKSVIPGSKTSNFRILREGSVLKTELDVDSLYFNFSKVRNNLDNDFNHKMLWASLISIMNPVKYEKICNEHRADPRFLGGLKISIARRLQLKMKRSRKIELANLLDSDIKTN